MTIREQIRNLFVLMVALLVVSGIVAVAKADEDCFIEDEYVIITPFGAKVVYEDELVTESLNGRVYDSWFVDGDGLIPCEVLSMPTGIYIRLFRVKYNYAETIEIWKCEWCPDFD